MPPGVAPGFAADLRPSVRTGVEQYANLAVLTVRDDDGPARDVPGNEIARLAHFRFMGGVQPAAIENALALHLEDVGIGKKPTGERETGRVPGRRSPVRGRF